MVGLTNLVVGLPRFLGRLLSVVKARGEMEEEKL